MLTQRLNLSLIVASVLAPASFAQQDGPVWFEEIGAQLGVDWQHVSGAREGRFWFPEIMGGGVAMLDYDGDGDLDLYFVQSGRLDPQEGEDRPGNKLYRNDLPALDEATGELTPWRFVDVTAETKVGDNGYGMGVACGDYDQDGDMDLYVTNIGANVLYRNDGRGRFKDVTSRMGSAGHHSWGTSAGFFDADMDGDLDIFLVNNLNWEVAVETPCTNFRNQPDYCSPNNYNSPATDTLLLLGRLGYQDAGPRLGLPDSPANGLGVCIADYDRDGDQDIYVANDATPNALWRNEGGRRLGKSAPNKATGLVDVAPRSGCAVNMNGTPEAGMGVQWVDLDQDGWLDLFMTHLGRETNTYYRNRKGRFLDMTRRTGMVAAALKFTGFGLGFHDYDQDGELDLYVANGAVQAWGEDQRFDPADPYAEPNHLFRGQGKARFEFLGEGTATPMIGSSRGAAFGDLDNDGAVDVVVVDRDNRVRILHNVAPKQGGWVGLRLLNRKGADALGTLVKLTSAWTDGDGAEHTREQWRLASPVYSYLASNDARVHFGLPTGDTVTALEVIWPGKTDLQALDLPTAGEYSTRQQH
jgi:enediyne biosynthesis protein E4